MAIAVVARFKVSPDRTGDFERMFADLRAKVMAEEPGCHVYHMVKSRKEADVYVAMEIYADQAALDLHGGTAWFQAARPQLIACLSAPPEREFLDTVD